MIFESLILASYLSGINKAQIMNTTLKKEDAVIKEVLNPMFTKDDFSLLTFDGEIMFDFENDFTINSDFTISKDLQKYNLTPKWNIFYLNFNFEHKVNESLGGCTFDSKTGAPLRGENMKAKVESYNTLVTAGICLNKKLFADSFNLYSKGDIGYSFSNYSFNFESTHIYVKEKQVIFEELVSYNSSFTKLSTYVTRLELGFNWKIDKQNYGIRADFKIGMLSYQDAVSIINFKPVNVKNYVSGDVTFIINNLTFKTGINYYCMHPETPWEPEGKPGMYNDDGFVSSKLDESRIEIFVGVGYRFKN